MVGARRGGARPRRRRLAGGARPPSGRRALARGWSTAVAAPRWPRSPSSSPAASRCWRSAPTPRAGARLRRRRPTRAGSARWPPLIACSRCGEPGLDAALGSAEARAAAAPGLVLADWGALARRPTAAPRFRHVVADRPAAVRAVERLARAGSRLPAPGLGAEPRSSWPSAASGSSGSRAARSPRSGGPAREVGRRGRGRAASRPARRAGRALPHARGSRRAASPLSASSGSANGARIAPLLRSGSYPRRRPSWSDPAPTAPAAPGTRRQSHTCEQDRASGPSG